MWPWGGQPEIKWHSEGYMHEGYEDSFRGVELCDELSAEGVLKD